MKVLVGVTNFTHGKAYVWDAFERMAESCIAPVVGEENILVVGDQPIGTLQHIPMPCPGVYAEDMLIDSREAMFQIAKNQGYDKLVLQGVDALFQTERDFERLVTRPPSFDLIAPLISARSDSNAAVCRRFYHNGESQVDVPHWELMGGKLVPTGFPGADNIVVNKQCFDVPFRDGHDPWYRRVEEGRPNLCVEENFVLNCQRRGFQAWCDTGIKVWHVHEDGIARMFKGIEKPLAELEWE